MSGDPMSRFVPPLLLLAACNDVVLVPTDAPPTVLIEAPFDGAQFDEGVAIDFLATVRDDSGVVTVAWIDNGTPLITGLVPDDLGKVAFSTAALAPGAHAMVLHAVDGSNQATDVSVAIQVLRVSQEPSLTVVHPVGGERATQDTPFLLEAVVEDAQDDPRELFVEVVSQVDGLLCTMDVDDVGSAVCAVEIASVADHRLVFSVTDTDGNVTSRTVLLPVDPIPQAPTVTVAEPAPGDVLRVGEDTLLRVSVRDGQEPATALTVTASSDVEGALCDLFPDLSGQASCLFDLTTTGRQQLTVSVRDSDGNLGQARVDVRVSDGLDVDDDADGWTELEGDCDDADDGVFPGATEAANGRDDDCDGAIDEGTAASDDDGDGYCESGAGCVGDALPGDCDDGAPSVNPSSSEDCTTGFDDDCDGRTNQADALACTPYFRDADRDAWGVDGDSTCTCAGLYPYTALKGGDCDDTRGDVRPDAIEDGNGVDDDCDGTVDDGTGLRDDDGDGFCESVTTPCSDGAALGDCQDAAAAVNPGAPEVCGNGVDDDCSGRQDEPGAQGCVDYHLDLDGDGYGDPDEGGCACVIPGNGVVNGADCDDGDFGVNPGATERANGADDDCDGLRDEGTPYGDDDRDGWCEASTCTTQADGRTPAGGDCDDTRGAVNPGAVEVCVNGLDDDCDGQQDEGEDVVACLDWWRDADRDGFGGGEPRCTCAAQGEYTAPFGGDCLDSNPAVYPGQQAWHDNDRGDGSYDWDCDGVQEPRWDTEVTCDCKWTLGFFTFYIDHFEAGWDDGTPGCGDTGLWWTYCNYPELQDADLGICLPISPAEGTSVSRVQQCR